MKLGGNNGQRVEILSGLKAGEEVVTRGAIQVKLAASSGVPFLKDTTMNIKGRPRTCSTKIIAFSLRNRALVLLATLILIIGGCWTAKHMEVDVFPDLNAPDRGDYDRSQGNGRRRGGTPRDVPHRNGASTVPPTCAVCALFKHRRILCGVWVEFDWDTDISTATAKSVSEKLSTIADAMPEGGWHTDTRPAVVDSRRGTFIGLTADSTSQTDLRTLAD